MAVVLKDVELYTDEKARQLGEPGIAHAYPRCVTSAVKHLEGQVDPSWVMGVTGFAFRIFVNEILCPSAMSIFNFSSILPEAIEQCGYTALHVGRFWEQQDQEESRRLEAQAEIHKAIDAGRPAIAWDIAESDWGLIIGFDDVKQEFATITCEGTRSTLPYDKLGKNGIDILSVAILTERNRRTRDEIIRRALQLAVAHAAGKEWTDRPAYQNGLDGYDLWTTVLERGAILADAGKRGNVAEHVPCSAAYYARVNGGARCYARDFLKSVCHGDTSLEQATGCYEKTAEALRPVWQAFDGKNLPDGATLRMLSQKLRLAKSREEEAIEHIRDYLSR
jgi:hypothetical protein